MNNFSSASAIVTALMSPKVAMLVLVCNSESKVAQIINTLNRDLAPESGAYHDTLRQVGTKELIPWLGMVGPTYVLLPPHLDFRRPLPFHPQLNLRALRSHC
jgi:hypothetical protein